MGRRHCLLSVSLILSAVKRIDPPLPEANFKDIIVSHAASPRSLRSTRRSAQARQTSSYEAHDEFKEPVFPRAGHSSSSHGDENGEFIVPASASIDDGGAREMREMAADMLGNAASSFKLPVTLSVPTSSATASLTLSSFDDNPCSSASSLSSPPASPILDASQEHHEFRALHVPEYDAPVIARCPMCKEVVDRDFLETFDCGRRMNVKTQTRFCRAHKQQSARSKWRERGYPRIDWATFDNRLKRHHPRIRSILDADVHSYYKNVLQDSIKGGRNRTLHQSLMSKGFHGLTPGYYGSKGARLMYVCPLLFT